MSELVQEGSFPGQAQATGALASVRRVVFFVSLPFGILSFVLPVYGKQIGADAIQIGMFFSSFSLMTVLLRPLAGLGVDRIGRRPFFLAGVAGYSASMFVFALSAQVWVILLASALQGMASSCLWLATNAITVDVAGPDERGRAFGSVSQSSNQGAFLGTFIGFGVILSLGLRHGWPLLFTGYSLASLLATLLAWNRLPETQPAGLRTRPAPIRWSRPWMLLLLVTFVTAASWALVSPVLMIYLQEKLSIPVEQLAAAYIPAALVWSLLPTRLGWVADRLGRKPLMVAGMAVAASSSFLIPELSSLAGLAALWALQALCYAAGDPAEQALVADLTGGEQRGRAYGLYALAAGLGATAGPLLGGWLYERLGPPAPFFANGLLLALSTLVLFVFLQIPAAPLTNHQAR